MGKITTHVQERIDNEKMYTEAINRTAELCSLGMLRKAIIKSITYSYPQIKVREARAMYKSFQVYRHH